jgi:DNA-binding transcriptional LysR family regulator
MKYAVEVAKCGSLNKASEILLIAQPNLSRSIKDLESDLGIVIFERTTRGMFLTPEGEEFINYAKGILDQIEQVEKYYRENSVRKQKFSISVPRACYISEAFAEFSKSLTREPAEVFYKETNSQSTIRNILENNYNLGIIRYAEHYDRYFKEMLEEKDICYELVTEFRYHLLMSNENPLAGKQSISFEDLSGLIEIAHADPYVPSMPLSKVMKEELPDNIDRRIFIYERGSQFDLLSRNPETFMWVSLVPRDIVDRYHLTERICIDNTKVYKDVLVYRNGYKLSQLDKQFITALCEAKRKNKS